MALRSRQTIYVSVAVAGLVIASVILIRRLDKPSPPDPTWQVLSDDSGEIRHVVCVVNSARRAVLHNAALVTRIVNALPPGVKVTILTNDRAAFKVVRNPHLQQVDFVELPFDRDFTIWPQDPFLVLIGSLDQPCLLGSAEFDRADDRLLPKGLAEHLGCKHRTSELSFQGGNLVVGSRHVFVGAETIRHNALRLNISDEEAVHRFQQELGRSVIVLGPLPQPVAHIDMVVTPLDAHHLAVADPSAGAHLARSQLTEQPEMVRSFERSCEALYFGHPGIHVLRDRKGKEIRPQQIVGQTETAATACEKIGPHLDKLALHLEDFGYKVYRVPYLARGREEPDEKVDKHYREHEPSSGNKEPMAGYPCLTYNNVLMERHGDSRVVYLPQYGWAAMDSAARKAWKRMGYEVVAVEGLTTSAISGGSLRCCVKVIQRGKTLLTCPVPGKNSIRNEKHKTD